MLGSTGSTQTKLQKLFLAEGPTKRRGAKGCEAKVGDGMAEFQSSEIMIDGFLEMSMGKIQ